MKAVRWLTSPAIITIQAELIARYGGKPGMRSVDSLESALARPKHLATYKRGVSVPQLAASYGWRLLRNHAFVDGNKRIAIAAAIIFLELNGWELLCGEAEETAMVLRAAAGDITEAAWTRWMQQSARRK